MRILTIPKAMTEEDAFKIAKNGGNILGRLAFGKKEITLKLMYLESREIIYSMTYQNAPLLRLARLEKKEATQKIRMLVEGTRCTPSYVEQELCLHEVEVADESIIQKSTFSDEKMIEEGKRLVRRMIRRQVGKTISAQAEEIRSIYRPFYIAFYGEMTEGTKVHYLPIAADGNEIRRTC